MKYFDLDIFGNVSYNWEVDFSLIYKVIKRDLRKIKSIADKEKYLDLVFKDLEGYNHLCEEYLNTLKNDIEEFSLFNYTILDTIPGATSRGLNAGCGYSHFIKDMYSKKGFCTKKAFELLNNYDRDKSLILPDNIISKYISLDDPFMNKRGLNNMKRNIYLIEYCKRTEDRNDKNELKDYITAFTSSNYFRFLNYLLILKENVLKDFKFYRTKLNERKEKEENILYSYLPDDILVKNKTEKPSSILNGIKEDSPIETNKGKAIVTIKSLDTEGITNYYIDWVKAKRKRPSERDLQSGSNMTRYKWGNILKKNKYISSIYFAIQEMNNVQYYHNCDWFIPIYEYWKKVFFEEQINEANRAKFSKAKEYKENLEEDEN